MVQIKINDIEFNEDLYPRENRDWIVVTRYVDRLAIGHKAPPIIVTKKAKRYLLVDGLHRLEAWKRYQNRFAPVGKHVSQTINAEIVEYKSDLDLYKDAIKRNMEHGIPLGTYDKLNIALRLKRHGMKLSQIAPLLYLPIVRLEKQLADRLQETSMGPIILKRTVAHLATAKGQASVEITHNDQMMYSGANQSYLIWQIINVIREGWLDKKDSDVILAIRELSRTLSKYKTDLDLA